MIALLQIGKKYRSGRGVVTALENISFTVESGESLVIAGKSGSGKSTLLNCLAGLEKPDHGSIRCAGDEIHRLSRRALSRYQRSMVGFVFQRGNLLSCLTVSENLQFPLALNGVTGCQIEKRVRELLEHIGMPDFGPALPGELSGGETQRVAFARAIAHKPALLLADEPTANLDSATGRLLIDLMLSMNRKEKRTLVVASHDPEVIRMTARRFQLKDGREEILS